MSPTGNPFIDQVEDVITRAMVTELQVLDLQGPYVLELSAFTAFQLIGVLQLVLRHPNLPDNVRGSAQELREGLGQIFAEAPACSRVIERGDNPDQDAHRNRDQEPRIIIP